jgi:histidyl-tRNA synthetase
MFAGRSIPTTGVSFGIERMVDVITSLGMYAPGTTPSQALVTVFDASNESAHASLGLASELRAAGIPCEVHLNPGDKLGKQFSYADKAGIRFAIVIGPDELREGNVALKDLKAPPPNQQTVTRSDLASTLQRALRA